MTNIISHKKETKAREIIFNALNEYTHSNPIFLEKIDFISRDTIIKILRNLRKKRLC